MMGPRRAAKPLAYGLVAAVCAVFAGGCLDCSDYKGTEYSLCLECYGDEMCMQCGDDAACLCTNFGEQCEEACYEGDADSCESWETSEGAAVESDVSDMFSGWEDPISYNLDGINIGPLTPNDTDADLTSAYQTAGITHVRTHDFKLTGHWDRTDLTDGVFDMRTFWDGTDPSSCNAYDFSVADQYFDAIVSGGFDVYFRIGDSFRDQEASWIDPITDAGDQEDWAEAAAMVMSHFLDGTCPSATISTEDIVANWAGAVSAWEIWNEPNFDHFWNDGADGTGTESGTGYHRSTDFAQFFEVVFEQLRTEFPEERIGGPGFAGMGSQVNGHDYYDGLLRHFEEDGLTPDFVSWHIYSDDPEDIADEVRWSRDTIDDRLGEDVESHLTEWNLETDEYKATGVGASRVAATFVLLTELRQEGEIDDAIFYRGPGQDCEYAFDPEYETPCASGHAIWMYRRLGSSDAGRMMRLEFSGSSEVYALAAASESIGLRILLANPDDEDHDYTFDGLPETPTQVLRYRIERDGSCDTCSSTGETVSVSGTAITGTVGAYEAELIEATF